MRAAPMRAPCTAGSGRQGELVAVEYARYRRHGHPDAGAELFQYRDALWNLESGRIRHGFHIFGEIRVFTDPDPQGDGDVQVFDIRFDNRENRFADGEFF